jgi:hypothetical protein
MHESFVYISSIYTFGESRSYLTHLSTCLSMSASRHTYSRTTYIFYRCLQPTPCLQPSPNLEHRKVYTTPQHLRCTLRTKLSQNGQRARNNQQPSSPVLDVTYPANKSISGSNCRPIPSSSKILNTTFTKSPSSLT